MRSVEQQWKRRWGNGGIYKLGVDIGSWEGELGPGRIFEIFKSKISTEP